MSKKHILFASNKGMPILISATQSPGNLIHVVPDGYNQDELYLRASNLSFDDATLTLELADGHSVSSIKDILNNRSTRVVGAGLLLHSGVELRAYSNRNSEVSLFGHVKRTELDSPSSEEPVPNDPPTDPETPPSDPGEPNDPVEPPEEPNDPVDPEPTLPQQGWTAITPSSDSRIVYVSSSNGNDNNDGLSENTPKATISAGMRLLRDGFPDHLYLKRGDIWQNQNLHIAKSGRGIDEPLVIGAYGDVSEARPKLNTGSQSGVVMDYHANINYVSVFDLECEADRHNPDNSNFDPNITDCMGVNATSQGSNWLIEGCRFSWYNSGMVIQNIHNQPIQDVKIRRCVIDNCYNRSGFEQGMYYYDVDGLLIEECLIDRVAKIPGVSEGSIFDHAVYFQNGSDQAGRAGDNTTFRNNIVARSDGIQMREGGRCLNNLFVRTWIAIQLGGGNDATPGGVVVKCDDNVILDGDDINDSNPRGWGIKALNINGSGSSSVSNNIVANNTLGDFPFPYQFDANSNFDNGHRSQIRNLTISGNKSYGWGGTQMFFEGARFENVLVENNMLESNQEWAVISHNNQDAMSEFTADNNVFWNNTGDEQRMFVAGGNTDKDGWVRYLGSASGNQVAQADFVDPTRDLNRYDREVLGGNGDLDMIINRLKEQRKGNWLSDLTTNSINSWVRDGFVR